MSASGVMSLEQIRFTGRGRTIRFSPGSIHQITDGGMVLVDADESDVHHLVKLSQAFGHPAPNLRRFHFALEFLFHRSDHPLDQFLSSNLRYRSLSAGNVDALQDLAGVKSLPGAGSLDHTQSAGTLGSFHGRPFVTTIHTFPTTLDR